MLSNATPTPPVTNPTYNDKFCLFIWEIVIPTNKRIKDKSFNIEEFEEKIEFATKELEKVGYFELKNASFETFLNYSETKNYGSTLPNAIMKLKERCWIYTNAKSNIFILYWGYIIPSFFSSFLFFKQA